jgi:hypothetical protein
MFLIILIYSIEKLTTEKGKKEKAKLIKIIAK